MAREMKDSGIEWFGSIPVNWKKVAVKRLFEIGRGRVIATTELSDFGYPVYSSQTKNNGVLGYIDTYDYNRSQLTWTTDGANAGTVFLREGKHNCTNVCGTLMPILESANNLRYLKYIVSYTAFFHKRADINGYKIMNNEMAEIIIILPSQEEQNRIADFLDTQCAHIDSVIEKTRAAIEEYKRLKQSVITQAVTKGIRPNREMKDSGIEWIGEIPKEWKAILIIRLLDYSHPYPLGDGDHGLIKTESYQQTGIPYIRVQNLSWGQDLILDNLVYISEKDNNRIINSTLKPNDILFAKTGATIGKTGIVPNSIPVANTTSHIGKLTLSNTVNSKYVFYSLSSHVGYRQFWERACLKATRPELTIDEIRSIKVILPDSFTEQSEIVAYLDEKTTAIDSLIQKKEQLISELEAYKKSLIYEYVTGKKEVPVHAH